MDKNYTQIEYQDKKIYLIGTAHVSKVSVEEVTHAIEEINPDCICIELDQARYDSLNNPKKWEDTNIIDVIKRKQVGMLLVNIILSSFQKRVAKNLDTQSGQEMIEGIKQAKERSIELALVDRSVQTTFMRIWRKHSFIQKIKLASQIFMSIFEDDDISEEDLANLKQADMLESALQEVGKNFPIIKAVLVDERDQYLAEKIKQAKGTNIIAILGAAHLPGVLREINHDHDLKALDNIPAKKVTGQLIGWAIPILIIGLIAYTLFTNSNLGFEQIKNWILWNGSLSAFGVLIAGGHLLSIFIAFIAAPITSLNPLLAAGWFAGIAEASIKKPTVKDFENLSTDATNLRGFRKNRVTRILLIVMLANLFSTIGTVIGGYGVLEKFFSLF